MVATRSTQQPKRPGFTQWLEKLSLTDSTKDKLRAMITSPDILLIGQEMVEILHELNMDDVSLQAALVYPYCQRHELDDQQIEIKFGKAVQQLVSGVRRMDAIRSLHYYKGEGASEEQIDSVRRMLLAMVEDVRAILIKLAERICDLQNAKNQEEESKVLIARECAAIYAPLANRLGIGQLKWELEDLSFRYLHPNTYKQIACKLDERRIDREQYIVDFVQGLQRAMDEHQINAEVYGRPKHIFSIWKKMHKKSVPFEQLFDIRAVRIISEGLQDCYAALGIVHARFQHIAHEFDDYIAKPKSNGYQSIHTVVSGPENRTIEIQIRTRAMHENAELGVAAHWKYKEGNDGANKAFEERVNWLRKLITWQEEDESGDLVEELRSQVFDDRVYVSTPKGDVVDLPYGATPLDFAYYVHTNIGHRSTGAKIDGRIVPFTYKLQNGDRVEVLTGKKLNPSRDWMNPSLGYVYSSRARAKIHSWFKQQDKDKNRVAGKEMLEAELSKQHLPVKSAEQALTRFDMSSLDDLYAAIGGGYLRIVQVVNYLTQLHQPEPEIHAKLKTRKRATKPSDTVVVEGVGNLMSQIARCCSPVPGDPIVGYITLGKGVSVHRTHCEQLRHMLKQHPEREIEVSWEQETAASFAVQLNVFTADRDGVLRDITTLLATERAGLLGVHSMSNPKDNTAKIKLQLEVKDLGALSKLTHKLQLIRGVVKVERQDG